jgi:hypothetical protein
MLGAVLMAAGITGAMACSSEPESQKDRIRAMVKRAEAAVKDKDMGELSPLISDGYRDGSGHDKKAIEAMLRYHFLRHRSIHLFTRIKEITLTNRTRADLIVLVAMAGRPISKSKDLLRFRADLYRFEIGLAADAKGRWKAIQCQWQQALPRDFL